MPDEIRDKVTLSDESKVAKIISNGVRENLDRMGFLDELEADCTVSFVEFSKELAKKILTLLDEREVPGWVVATACSKHPDVGEDCMPCKSYSNINYPKCSNYGAKTRPATQIEVNNGTARKENDGKL